MNIKLGHQYTSIYASIMLGQVDKSYTMNMNLFQELMILVSGICPQRQVITLPLWVKPCLFIINWASLVGSP